MNKNELITLIKEVLGKGYLLSLATTDSSGLWVCDLVYVNDDDLNIYWMSGKNTRHSLAILNNAHVACSITANNPGEENKGVQISGIAEVVEGNPEEIAKKQIIKRNKEGKLTVENILPPGHSWYKLTPKMIDIIYEPLWGFKKEKIEL